MGEERLGRTMTHLPVMSFMVISGGAAIVRID